MAYDNICCYLTTEYPANFVHWLLNIDANIIEPLPTELSVNPIRSDALYFLPEQQQILHLEFQTSHISVPALPLRMLDYWVRLYRQYQCRIEQIVIFLKQTSSDAVYEDQLAIDNTSHRYRVVRLWEQDPTPLLASPALLPLAVLAQTNSPEALLRQVAGQIDMIEELDEQRNIAACVELLASLKFDKNLIQRYLREDLMQEAPLYQEIVQLGVKRGTCATVLRLLNRRIGTINPQLQARIQNLEIAQLDELSEALLEFSGEADLVSWLNNQA